MITFAQLVIAKQLPVSIIPPPNSLLPSQGLEMKVPFIVATKSHM